MPQASRPPVDDPRGEDVLTLAEAAAYLRVTEDTVLQMAVDGLLPSQKIGVEWRFLRRALSDWLRYGGRHFRKWPYPPELLPDEPLLDCLIYLLERRLKAEAPPKPGSKQAVLKHFGAFRDDDDLNERLADARARRGAAE